MSSTEGPESSASSPRAVGLQTPGSVFLLLSPLLAAQAGLLWMWDLGRHIEAATLLLVTAVAALAWAALRLERVPRGSRLAKRLPVLLLLGAVALRLPALPLPLTLSDDARRYLWDGRVVLAGENPYRLPPDAPELSALRDAAWQRLPHRQVPAVYPPGALGLFALASWLPAPLLAWKAMLVVADLAGCWALLALAERRGVPVGRVAWYAWNPLVVLEGAGMGHVDALGAAAAVVAVAAACAARPVRAGLAAAAGALAKLAPLAALPAWARASGRRGRFLAVAVGVTAAVLLPMLVAAGGIPAGLKTYAVSWEFNGPVFEPLWRLLDGADAAPRLAHLLDRVKEWTAHRWDGALNHLYPYLYPQLLAKLLLAAGMVAVVWRSARTADPVAATGRLFGGLLLLSATVYPWYLLWVLPWAALARHPAWLALSGIVLASYWAKPHPEAEWPWIYLAVWMPFFALLFFSRGSWRERERLHGG